MIQNTSSTAQIFAPQDVLAPRAGAHVRAVQSSRRPVLEDLRASIRRLEGRQPVLEAGASGCSVGGVCAYQRAAEEGWTFGAPEIDARLGGAGLDPAGVHELKPGGLPDDGRGVCAAEGSAMMSFALRLCARRLAADATGDVLWCWPRGLARELGGLYGPGLAGLGFDPARLLVVETSSASEMLWSLEEAIKSRALALVAGFAAQVDLTPARRLALAAKSSAVPCLLMTSSDTPPAAATATRWRVARSLSVEHPFDARAPGVSRYEIFLERCRQNMTPLAHRPVTLEWAEERWHETHRFSVAGELADGTAGACRSALCA